MHNFFGQPTPGADSQPSGPAPTGTSSPDDRATQFRPVEGGSQTKSGEKLLVEAYAAFWLIAFVFILLSWRRQRQIDERVANLESAIARARRADASASDDGDS